MPAVEYSIGATGRDYATFTLAEADLSGEAGNDVTWSVYNDAAFGESLNLSSNTPDSLVIRVADGERHDGTAGTGARNVFAGQWDIDSSKFQSMDGLEFDGNGGDNAAGGLIDMNGIAGAVTFSRLLMHSEERAATTGNLHTINLRDNGDRDVHNCIFYDIRSTSGTNGTVTAVILQAGTSAVNLNNCTIHDIDNSGSGPCNGLWFLDDDSDVTVQNTIVTDVTGGGNVQDFDTASNVNESYNASEDATASGTGSVTGVDPADLYVSTTGGSEDLHLKSTATDVIGAGTDLGTTDGVNIDINGADRDGSLIAWDMGAHQYQFVYSVGATARDYATWTLAAADLDLFNGSAVELRGYNDSVFDEEPVFDSDTVLDSLLVTVADGERHDGTAGTGCRINSTATGSAISILTTNNLPSAKTVEWLEITGSEDTGSNNRTAVDCSKSGHTFQNLLIYNIESAKTVYAIDLNTFNANVYNCTIFDIRTDSASNHNVYGVFGTNEVDLANLTIHDIRPDSSTGTGAGVDCNDANASIQNAAVTSVSGSSSGTQECFDNIAGTEQYNASDDGTAAGTGSLTGVDPADLYVSSTRGSEDLHQKAGSDLIGAGVDLASDVYGVDINGNNRNSYDLTTWDIGAHQYQWVLSVGTSSRDFATLTLLAAAYADFAGDAIEARVYNDSVFDEVADADSSLPDVAVITVPSSERHDGTAGTGARFVSSGSAIGLNHGYSSAGSGDGVTNRVTEWLEMDANGGGGGGDGECILNQYNGICRYVLAHSASGFREAGITTGGHGSVTTAVACVVYDIDGGGSAGEGFEDGTTSGGAVSEWYNCTAHNVVQVSGNAIGFNAINASNRIIRNCLVTGCDNDFAADLSSTTSNNNASEDGTAPGTSSLTNIDVADLHVSTTVGSEDLHVTASSDVVGQGSDLGTATARGVGGLSIDIDNSDRDAVSRAWDIGADQAGLTITSTIGSDSRDYATHALWEADLDNTSLYIKGDTATGEAYNDSVFTGGVTIDGGGTVGLSEINLTVAAGERHDGTAGTGVRIVPAANGVKIAFNSNINGAIEWHELDYTETYQQNAAIEIGSTAVVTKTIAHCIVHDVFKPSTIGTGIYGISAGQSSADEISYILNNLVYDLRHERDGGGNYAYGIHTNRRYRYVYNNTVDNIFSEYDARGIDATVSIWETIQKNNVATNINSNTLAPTGIDDSASDDYNATEDASADQGANSLTGLDPADLFTSLVDGSEDYTPKASADIIQAGTDLGTSPTGVNLDLKGFDRDAEGVDWDIGAIQQTIFGGGEAYFYYLQGTML